MRENVIFIPAVILMIVEAFSLGFLIWAWFDANGRSRDDN